MDPVPSSPERLKALTREFLAARPSLMAFIAAMVQDPGAAEDIYQEVWVRLSEAVERGVPIGNPTGWFRGVARNLILMHWRSQGRAESRVRTDSRLLEAADRAFARHDAEPEWWSERHRALRRCLEELPAKSSRLLQLIYERSLGLARTARLLGISYAAAATALSRLRQALLECMRRKLGSKESGA